MYAWLKSYIEGNKLLFKAQYGFIEWNFILSIKLWTWWIRQEQLWTRKCLYIAFYPVFHDFKRAFDTVNHTILRDKLQHYGIRGIVHEWFSSYFAERTQTRHIDNDHISSKKNSVTWVPQGSVLTTLCKRSSSIYILIGFLQKASTGRQSFYQFAPFCLVAFFPFSNIRKWYMLGMSKSHRKSYKLAG